MRNFRYRPYVVQAHQWDGEKLPEHIAEYWAVGPGSDIPGAAPGKRAFLKSDLKVTADPGFWLVLDENNFWRAMGPDYFKHHFFELDDGQTKKVTDDPVAAASEALKS